MSDGRVDNRRLGRTADLRKVGEESGKILEVKETFRLRNGKSEDNVQGTAHSESHVSGARQHYGWHAAQRC